MSGGRHPIATVFATIKTFRGSATRYDTTETRCAAAIHRAAGVIAARYVSTGPRENNEFTWKFLHYYLIARSDGELGRSFVETLGMIGLFTD